ncbi:putative proline permease [Diaporthe ampelina]|uniref:Putative proline permease n=1 Tax=Diaporthe ampelina TaxID=1214573 RepID=A0A0G2FSE6_9PEZI|nr:putative proline permease [Diaporthe ampelina]
MGGPCFLSMAYVLMSLLVYGIVMETTELSSYLPVRGSSVSYFGSRYVSNSLGFVLGWIYWYIFAISLASAWSAGNLYLYLSSRALYSMALVGTAPRFFAKCTKSGVP